MTANGDLRSLALADLSSLCEFWCFFKGLWFSLF